MKRKLSEGLKSFIFKKNKKEFSKNEEFWAEDIILCIPRDILAEMKKHILN